LWAKRLVTALTGAIDVQQLADEWLRIRKDTSNTASSAPNTLDATVFLGDQNQAVHAVIGQILNGVYADGMVVGQQASVALLNRVSTVDWGNWSPGDTQAANEILGTQGGAGLQAMLDAAGVTINSIASNRIDELAARLAEGLQEGWSSDQLGRSLSDVLDDPQWAELVASTEMTRAVSASTLLTYGQQGVTRSVWITAEDQRVCPVCEDNENESRALGEDFPSGDAQPPAHPRCRCALGPDISSITAESVAAAFS
jgi:SPP1 gp7 family putative phage head morphogenesis protein